MRILFIAFISITVLSANSYADQWGKEPPRTKNAVTTHHNAKPRYNINRTENHPKRHINYHNYDYMDVNIYFNLNYGHYEQQLVMIKEGYYVYYRLTIVDSYDENGCVAEAHEITKRRWVPPVYEYRYVWVCD